MKIHRLALRLSNAYLIVGDRPVLVDTGSPGDIESLRKQLRHLGVSFSDLALVLHTHVHSDHMGSSAEIAAETGCPMAFHPLDRRLAEQANNGWLHGIGVRGKVMSWIFSHTEFKSVEADVELYDEMSLHEYGIEANVLETPGHTAGSVSVLTQDGHAVVGDVLMGGYMGGAIFSSRPNYHYFAEDVLKAMASLDRVVARSTRNLYVGHGGPLAHRSVEAWRNRQLHVAS